MNNESELSKNVAYSQELEQRVEKSSLPALEIVGGRVEAANAAALALFGERVVGQLFSERFDGSRGNGSEAESTETADVVTALGGRAEGRSFLVRWADEGAEREGAALLIDITRQVGVEKALTNRLREVARAHRGGGVTSWELDLRTLKVAIPHRLPDGYGGAIRSLSFESVLDMIHPDDVEGVKTALRRAIEAGRLLVDARFVDTDGKAHWVELRGRAVPDARGDIVAVSGVSIGLGSDGRRSTELESQLSLQMALLDHLADGVVRADSVGDIVAVNAAAERMTRWRSEEALGRPASSVVRLVDEETGEKIEIKPGEALDTGLHSRLIRRDGTELPVRCEIRRFETLQGEPATVIEIRDLSELRGLESQMLFRATHDGLTGLFDRVEFERRLGDALVDARGEGRVHALCYVDLDNFKIINDTCGHLAGDEMLKQIGSLLRCNFRGTDTLGRLGGDEFGVLLTDCPAPKAHDIAKSLCKDIKMFRFSWGDKVFNVTASVGLVGIDGQTSSVAEVLGAADGACYIAKKNGSNRVEVYRPDDTVLSERRDQLELVQAVQHALATDTFELHGQPIQPLHERERKIIELLLRMRDEDGDLILPGEFMRVAEGHGMAVMIDRWVVRQALLELGESGEAAGFEDVAFAINLSGQSLGDETFLQFVLAQFENSRVDPARVYFEITETAAISHLGRAMRFITALRGLGCVFVLDDFGAGLSSFGYLRNLPVGLIKIDGQFVKGLTRDPIQRALVEAINQIGHVMQMRTVAESVEDEETLKALHNIKVDYAQGFHVARPAPLSELRMGPTTEK